MVAVSGGLLFAGYQLLVYGWSQVNHGNAGFFDTLWPGRYTGNPLDGPASNGTSQLGGGTFDALGNQVTTGNIGSLPTNVGQVGQGTAALGPGTFRTAQQNAAAAAAAKGNG